MRAPNNYAHTTESILSFTDRSGGPVACWPWTRAKTTDGYPEVQHRGKTVYATRLLMELITNRKLSRREYVLHRCDNPPCLNPKHLFIGSHIDNVLDMTAKKRGYNSRKTHCQRGHEFTVENTYKRPSGVRRECRICRHLAGIKHRTKVR